MRKIQIQSYNLVINQKISQLKKLKLQLFFWYFCHSLLLLIFLLGIWITNHFSGMAIFNYYATGISLILGHLTNFFTPLLNLLYKKS